MTSRAEADLSGLATLAQTRDGDLRPLLLRTQTTLFVTAPHRDPATVATFETLALGLIPLVDDATVAAIAGLLATVPDAPERVLARLRERAEAGRAEAALDLAVVADLDHVLDGRMLASLVERARTRPALARALLARPEPTVFDRAALYRFADEKGRAAIRDGLARHLPQTGRPRSSGAAELRDRILAGANGRLAVALLADAGLGPGRAWMTAGIENDPAEQDVLTFSLLAIGLAPEECTPLFLTLDPAISRSVETVFRLVRLARTTPAYVAAFLAEPEPAEPRAIEWPQMPDGYVPHHMSRTDEGRSLSRPDPVGSRRGGGPSVPDDRRSRATTGRDRT